MTVQSPSHVPQIEQTPPERRLYGVLAEFANAAALLHAAERVRHAGYTNWDCHSPYPVHGLDKAMGIQRTIVPWLSLAGGLTGGLLGLAMQLWMNGINYPQIVSDKPLFSVPANIPITFELTVLLSAFGAFFGMLVLNNLPMHYHPLHKSQRFKGATDDRFFVSIAAADPLFSAEGTSSLLHSLHATHVEFVEE